MIKAFKHSVNVKDRVPELNKALLDLVDQEVLVGVPADKADRKDGSPITNAALAYIHNTGSPDANIPARPFMEPGVKDARPKVIGLLKEAGQYALKLGGNSLVVLKYLHAVGLTVQNSIRARINEGPFEPLKPGTIAGRLRRGRTGIKPLIDTGQLRNAIGYVLRSRKRST